ncbi:alpha/beta hydrolase [Bacillus atrophaeus]|uniref:alpha/beta fold hydrolase n=1 Tax=Bacillus atrophaeus TaxID=1452 RepID=UPI002282BC4D|nr:alpha/beta hydrolase [Bacillus atrophaeus]MCY8484096.1 alpha/beta hydrolase [Bacillus atrophaeus]MCY9135309.1 alpha/beta hydrolase [Bacillus atrophaeus]
MSFKLPARFSEASADILVTAGEKERGILKTSVREIGNKNANCRCVMIPGTGHGTPFAQPELFNEMVEEWFFRETYRKNGVSSKKQKLKFSDFSLAQLITTCYNEKVVPEKSFLTKYPALCRIVIELNINHKKKHPLLT